MVVVEFRTLTSYEERPTGRRFGLLPGVLATCHCTVSLVWVWEGWLWSSDPIFIRFTLFHLRIWTADRGFGPV